MFDLLLGRSLERRSRRRVLPVGEPSTMSPTSSSFAALTGESFFFNNLRAHTVSGEQLLQQATIRCEGNLMCLGHASAYGFAMALKRWAVVGDKALKWSSGAGCNRARAGHLRLLDIPLCRKKSPCQPVAQC